MDIFESPAVDEGRAIVMNDIESDAPGAVGAAGAAVGADPAAVADAAAVAGAAVGADPAAAVGADSAAVAGADSGVALAGIVRVLFRVLCWFMLAAAVVYLGVAGMNYALISGVQIPAELRGTKILLTYATSQAALFAAAGIAGLVGASRSDAQRYLRLAPWAPAVLVAAAEATHMFNMGDHVLNNSFIFGANFFFGILAVLAGALAAVSLFLFKDQDELQQSLGRAVVAFETDPVVASQFSSSKASDAADAAGEYFDGATVGAADGADGAAEDAADGADGAFAQGDVADDAASSDGGFADEGFDGEDDAEDAYEGTYEDAVDDVYDDADDEDDDDDDDDEEVERPHGAHF